MIKQRSREISNYQFFRRFFVFPEGQIVYGLDLCNLETKVLLNGFDKSKMVLIERNK